MYQGVVHTSLRLRSRIYNNSLGERFSAFSSLELPSFETSFFATKTPLDVKVRSFGSVKASQSLHQFPADVMPLQKSSGGGG